MKDMVLALEWESSGAFRFVEAILDDCVVKILSLQDELWRAFVKSVSGLLAGKCCVIAVEVLKGEKKWEISVMSRSVPRCQDKAIHFLTSASCSC